MEAARANGGAAHRHGESLNDGRKKMRLFALFFLFLAGCASQPRLAVPVDYITGLVEPVRIAHEPIILDGGSTCMTLVDRNGREALVFVYGEGRYSNFGVSLLKRVKWGRITLADLEDGRVLDPKSLEAAALARLLASGHVEPGDRAVVEIFQALLPRMEEPIQASETTRGK